MGMAGTQRLPVSKKLLWCAFSIGCHHIGRCEVTDAEGPGIKQNRDAVQRMIRRRDGLSGDAQRGKERTALRERHDLDVRILHRSEAMLCIRCKDRVRRVEIGQLHIEDDRDNAEAFKAADDALVVRMPVCAEHVPDVFNRKYLSLQSLEEGAKRSSPVCIYKRGAFCAFQKIGRSAPILDMDNSFALSRRRLLPSCCAIHHEKIY